MYRHMVYSGPVMLILVMLGSTLLAADGGRVLFDFGNRDAAQAWVNVNDGVMGGLSDGRFKISENKTMEFYGTLSLENNGGFASVRSRPTNVNLQPGDSITARVRGDGREYRLNLYVPRGSGRYSFRQTFTTKKGEWAEVSLPVDSFVATWRGRAFPSQKLDPSKVNSVGFLLGDKKAGPFKLEVDWIKVTTSPEAQIPTKGLILDLNADQGVEVEDGDRVVKWTNQVTSFPAREFLKQDKGRKEPGSGRPTLKKSVATIGGHNTLVFERQELVNRDEDAFDHLLTGGGYTWMAVISVRKQMVQVKDVNSFFGNLKNGGMYEGIWGNVTDDNRVWIGSRNAVTFGRWDGNNPMVLAPNPLEENRYYVVAGRMGSGSGEVQIELFINGPQAVASKPFPVNPKANSSKLAIGQERDATNHPGKESFNGELARFLMYERPLSNDELRRTMESLRKTYAIP